MTGKLILTPLISIMFVVATVGQNFAEDTTTYEVINLELFLKNSRPSEISFVTNYPKINFDNTVQSLKRRYFEEVGDRITVPDSVSISRVFDKYSPSFQRDFVKDSRRLSRRLHRAGVIVLENEAGYVIKPRWVIEVDASSPDAFVITMEFIMMNTKNSIGYNLNLRRAKQQRS